MGWNRFRKSRSSIFDMLFKLDIGQKLAGSSEFRLGFLRRGVTNENLYLLGKVPHVKEILANLGENRITLFNEWGRYKIQRGRFGRYRGQNFPHLVRSNRIKIVENFAIVLIIRRTRGAKGCPRILNIVLLQWKGTLLSLKTTTRTHQMSSQSAGAWNWLQCKILSPRSVAL